nr:MAG TPA_asm: hypothetical protein [Caudoviricetes sp.]
MGSFTPNCRPKLSGVLLARPNARRGKTNDKSLIAVILKELL